MLPPSGMSRFAFMSVVRVTFPWMSVLAVVHLPPFKAGYHRTNVEDKYGMCKASIRFYGVGLNFTDRFWADGLTIADLRADLREIVRRVDDAGHLGARAELLGLARDVVRLWEARSAHRYECVQKERGLCALNVECNHGCR